MYNYIVGANNPESPNAYHLSHENYYSELEFNELVSNVFAEAYELVDKRFNASTEVTEKAVELLLQNHGFEKTHITASFWVEYNIDMNVNGYGFDYDEQGDLVREKIRLRKHKLE